MNNIWYLKDDDGQWIKLKYRPDLSGLEDVFEHMEEDLSKFIKKGGTVNMYYGTMKTLMDKGELLTEEECINQK